MISSDAEVNNYPDYKKMVEEVRLGKEALRVKDKSASGITLAAGKVTEILLHKIYYSHRSNSRCLVILSTCPRTTHCACLFFLRHYNIKEFHLLIH